MNHESRKIEAEQVVDAHYSTFVLYVKEMA